LFHRNSFSRKKPLARAKLLPGVKDAVLAYGFPEGGNSLSITKGIVSRVEFVPYNFPVSGLRIQIDAVINPGNSGGPAVVGDKMIGLTFSHLNDAQSIGYIIPNEEVELFLQDIADGHYDGKPAEYDDLQTLENPALRAFLNIPATVKGMVVNKPFQDAPPPPAFSRGTRHRLCLCWSSGSHGSRRQRFLHRPAVLPSQAAVLRRH
jgi:S1-C subfamily serine protease